MFLRLYPLFFVIAYVYSNVINIIQLGEKDMRHPGFVIKTLDKYGVLLCARMCERITRCTSINFNPSLLVCEILQNRSLPSNAASGWWYFRNTSWLQDVGQYNMVVNRKCGKDDISILLSNGEAKCIGLGLPFDCQDIQHTDATAQSSSYDIFPTGQEPMEVYCDMDTDGGGWTVFQSRQDGSVDFLRTWNDYKTGFGDVSGEFWLGNDNIHRLLSSHSHILRIDMEDFEGNRRYATYSTFDVSDEDNFYRIEIGGYSGDAGLYVRSTAKVIYGREKLRKKEKPGDSAGEMNGLNFSTQDADHDTYHTSCSVLYKGAWWYGSCHKSNLNGLYHQQSTANYAVGVVWETWKGYYYSLKRVTMKVKRK